GGDGGAGLAAACGRVPRAEADAGGARGACGRLAELVLKLTLGVATHAGKTRLHKIDWPVNATRTVGVAGHCSRQPLRNAPMLHYLWMFIVGIVVGAIARLIMPGSEHLGLLLTGVLGIAGSFVGGFIARIFNKPADGALVHPAGLILSVVGALILLYCLQHFMP